MLKKVNEAALLTIDHFGLGTLTAQEQSLSMKLLKVVRITCPRS